MTRIFLMLYLVVMASVAGCASQTAATRSETPNAAGSGAASATPGESVGSATAPASAGSGIATSASAGSGSSASAPTGSGTATSAPVAAFGSAESVAKLDPREKHLANLKQLTFGGENAEAYFSFDGQRLSFQSTRDGRACDQIYSMRIDGSDVQKVSNGQGVTTCSYYTPDGGSIIYASTHLAGPECPPRPDMSQGYTWSLYPSYDIFKIDLKSGALKRLTETPGYDAEATISPDGKTIIFTSVRDGDIELYTMDLEGRNIKRLTHTPGYDGGAFFSHDSRKIVWRASRPEGAALEDFRALLAKGLVRPSKLDIYVANLDGTGLVRLTNNGAANFAPYFLPDDSAVIFASNMDDPKGRDFELYKVNVDGSGLERVTFNETFDGFPMFSPDGKKLVFASNRNAKVRGETNVFIAEWVP